MLKDKDPAKVRRVTQAMLKMVKLDIAALENAFHGRAAA
jgi:predicted 3-demethylubiquinone-9 3-methyltransferase (glyoxalase superfamily)